MKRQTLCLLLPALLITGLLLLAGCGEQKASRLDGVPEPPEGVEAIPLEDLPVDPEEVAESYRIGMAVTSLELGVYVVPADTSFADLATYYRGLLNDDWQVYQSQQIQEARAEGIEATLWLNDEVGQMLSIQSVPAPEYGGNLLVVLFAEQ